MKLGLGLGLGLGWGSVEGSRVGGEGWDEGEGSDHG